MALPTSGKLSGSIGGKLIMVGGVASGAGTLVHQAAAGKTTADYVTIRGVNTDANADHIVVLEVGGSGQTTQIPVLLPRKSGFVTMADRIPLQTSLQITAYCADGSQLANLGGFFRRY